MRHFLLASCFLAALTSGPALSQQRAGPDPRLEAAMSTYVVSQIDRSVQFSKTIPPLEKPRRPQVDPGEAVKMGEDVYVERRLAPGAGTAGDENAVRIFRRDAR